MERIIALASAAPGQVHERTDDSAPNSGGRGGGGRGRGGSARGGQGGGGRGGGSRGGGGRGGGGRGHGRGGISDRDRLISKLPAALQPPIADGGWEMMSEQNSAAFEIITEEEYADTQGGQPITEKKTRGSRVGRFL